MAIQGGRNSPAFDGPTISQTQEANHRIANMLALLAGSIRLQALDAAKQSAGFSAEQVRLLLAATAARIDAVGQMHNLLSRNPDGAAVDLGEYLHNTCSAMRPFTSFNSRMELFCDSVPGCIVPDDEIVPIGLIVSEMIVNAAKYAHPAGVAGRIDVGCRRVGERIIVEVSDNGVGLPENFDVERGGGIGFKVVRMLASRLGAGLIFDSDTLGLRVLLLLPSRITDES